MHARTHAHTGEGKGPKGGWGKQSRSFVLSRRYLFKNNSLDAIATAASPTHLEMAHNASRMYCNHQRKGKGARNDEGVAKKTRESIGSVLLIRPSVAGGGQFRSLPSPPFLWQTFEDCTALH